MSESEPITGRYLVFSGADYYPSGGWDDFQGQSSELSLAIEIMKRQIAEGYEWAQIVDRKTGISTDYTRRRDGSIERLDGKTWVPLNG